MIISSKYTLSHEQKDGRRYVTEVHISDKPMVYQIEYLSSQDVDNQAVLDARSIQLEEDEIKERERVLVFLANRVVETKLVNYISGLSDFQLKNALSLTDEQVQKLRNIVIEKYG